MAYLLSKRLSGNTIEQFYLHIIAQNSVAWPHLAAKKSGKCSLYMTALYQNKNFKEREENGYYLI